MIINNRHKDRLFIFLFGNEAHKDWTLNLYNAINNSNYDDPEAISFNTLDDFLYMGMKNDVSFIINGQINLFEHQSTFNPNMPLRQLLYLAHIYEAHVHESQESLFSPKLLNLPAPKLYVFYNGTEQEDEEKILYLSDSFNGEGDIEAKVRMVNINYGHNEQLLHTCRQLGEYSWLIAEIRYNTNSQFMSLSEAIDNAIMKMPENYSIKDVIEKHQVEVKGMLFSEAETEFEMNKLKNQFKREIAEEIAKDNYEKGREEERERIKLLLLEKGADKEMIDLIDKSSMLKEHTEK